ncbi:CLASP N-terminal domain [Phytophthora cinnamomi]|uniref:CLASP N-terminal domain n=1 Tax=Phytophthora cinnamomi TaxID=4785 RepID=UPI00355941B6|nr:CLASP N-terminal domain [Phytophthora cinnamomi]
MRGEHLRLMTLGGRSNAVLELGKRLLQPEEEWKDKCAALTELRELLAAFARLQEHEAQEEEEEEEEEDGGGLALLFAPENAQALAQPFRATLTDLRSTVVREACATLALLARTLGPARCKILVRDVFPTLLDARGGSNKVNTAAVHGCIEAIVDATPSRFVLAPVLQVLETSKNREVRESCIHYTYLALEGWSGAALERFRTPLQTAIAASLSDASPKGREKARDCYWKYISLWPDEIERMNALLADGVKKHLKRSRKEAELDTSVKPAKRRHLATITNTVSAKTTAKSVPRRPFTLRFTRDRSEIEDEERRMNEANLLKRRLRRQRGVRTAGWTIFVALFVYLAFFASGMGCMPWTINAEIYPLRVRSFALSMATSVCWVTSLLVSFTFLSIVDGLSVYGAFWLYASIALLGFVYLWSELPETKGLELEEIQQIFERRVKRSPVAVN